MERRIQSRREFLGNTMKAAALAAIPSIVPSSVFGKKAPSNRINVAAIGTGRISRAHDMPGVWQHDFAQIMAVCDLDFIRHCQQFVLAREDRKLASVAGCKLPNGQFGFLRHHTFRIASQGSNVE